jgi:hypothetical protein
VTGVQTCALPILYKIVNSNNEIEYIGETKNPTVRLRHHICKIIT